MIYMKKKIYGIINERRRREKEVWHDNLERRAVNDGWGMCNTDSHSSQLSVCIFGGINCNVDHYFVKIKNLEQELK